MRSLNWSKSKMNTERTEINVSGIPVEVVRKDIKNLHVGVYPPAGRVRVAAPFSMDKDDIRVAIVSRLGWIKRRQAEFTNQERQSEREMVTGESHFFQGRRYRLNVIEHEGPAKVKLKNNTTMELWVRPQMEQAKRQELIEKWYRQQLRQDIPVLVEQWEPTIRVQINQWRIKKMKTKWGSCNIEAGRIWVNLELAKKPIECLEYIIVHEMVHMLERRHTDRFRDLMDQIMPDWQLRKDKLNQAPLAHEDWGY